MLRQKSIWTTRGSGMRAMCGHEEDEIKVEAAAAVAVTVAVAVVAAAATVAGCCGIDSHFKYIMSNSVGVAVYIVYRTIAAFVYIVQPSRLNIKVYISCVQNVDMF